MGKRGIFHGGELRQRDGLWRKERPPHAFVTATGRGVPSNFPRRTGPRRERKVRPLGQEESHRSVGMVAPGISEFRGWVLTLESDALVTVLEDELTVVPGQYLRVGEEHAA